MRVVPERPRRRVPQAPGHPEVDEESPAALEPDDQVLAAPLHGRDPLPLQLRLHLGGLQGAHEARVEDRDALETAPDEHRRELRADGLDLGQLGHVRSVRTARAAQAPSVSSTIGRGRGGSAAIA